MYVIWGRKTNGNTVKCFTWRGEPSEGLRQAYREAKDWDYDLAYCWAEPSLIQAAKDSGKLMIVRG